MDKAYIETVLLLPESAPAMREPLPRLAAGRLHSRGPGVQARTGSRIIVR
jgi:hypothetical protein